MSEPTPLISIILIGYDMASQLSNTLISLSPEYQRNCLASDYEVILVENESANCLDEATIVALPNNFSYFLRPENGKSPVPAINYAFEQCRGKFVGLIMDGARMLSPGVIHNVLLAMSLNPRAVVVIPGYHLGQQEQHLIESAEQALAEEAELLASCDWVSDGYALFNIATFSGANRRGYLQPIMECNCLFAAMDSYAGIGYADPGFTQPGGGSINLHMYRSLCMLENAEVFVIPGEGSFHQFHGGVTTSSYEGRNAELSRHLDQLRSYWPDGFHAVRRVPTLLGRVPGPALPFLRESSVRSATRLTKFRTEGRDPWPDDPMEYPA